MAGLSLKSRALLRSARRALKPKPADRARVYDALRGRLGAELLPPAAPTPTAWLAPRTLFGGSVAAGLLGAGVYLASAPHPPPAAPSASVHAPVRAVVPRIPEPPAAVAADPPRLQPAASQAAPRAPRAQTGGARDRLAEEVRLLSLATSALNAGQPAAALRSLDTHQRRFPRGTLTQERHAARAQALCALGRVGAGRVALEQLVPESPAAVRAKKACDAAALAREPKRAGDAATARPE